MDKSLLVKLLVDINEISIDFQDVEELFRKKQEDAIQVIGFSFEDILKNIVSVPDIANINISTYEWKHICLNFYILELLNSELSKSHMNVLSVQETRKVKTALQNCMSYGILQNLQTNLPLYKEMESFKKMIDHNKKIIYNYTILRCTTFGFCNCIKYKHLRMLILPNCLQGILVALFQLGYCPLKKPEKKSHSEFIMTEEMYVKLVEDQKLFKEVLAKMSQSIHPAIFIKETMILFQKNAPIWFKKVVSNLLTKMMRSDKGVQYIALAMLDGTDNDTTKTWKILDVLTKLVLSCRKFPDFKDNICQQLVNLLRFVKATDHELLIFERLFVSCTKSLHSEDNELCKVVFVETIMIPLLRFAHKEHKFRDCDDITEDIKQTVRLLYGCFADNSANSACLPMNLLKALISIIFYFYHLTAKSTFQSTNNELKELLTKYLQSCTAEEVNHLLDNFLFGFTVMDVLQFRNDVIIELDEKIVVKQTSQVIIYATADVMDTVYNLFNSDQKILLFGYLLKCISDKEKYFLNSRNSKELLGNEDHATSTVFERLLAIHKLLSQLSDNKEVQRSLRTKPDDIIEYINKVLCTETNDSQVIFTVVMILENLISKTSANTMSKFKVLIDPLKRIASKAIDNELKCLCNKLTVILKEEQNVEYLNIPEKPTEFDKALENVYDPLLPTRGHGLLTLAKLIENKNKEAMAKRQYLLNLFQLYLKDEDSFIYLNAVQGLAALADTFPDTVLEILCEEYADFSKKDAQETRMKLGEVLVRVVRLLGEMAPKYKALLLNTFLGATKDDDHLVRSSSLSSLGEVCRVLNYKLGTVVTEVLVCVHAIITTDKAVEPRRAAITVIRQLFVGLKSEMITFLKEDILPIYRTLKDVYYNDKDDVMRLQAQLALEELNENMKNVVFPNPKLHFEKKVIMLD